MAPVAWAAAFTAPPPQLLVPFLHGLVRSARGAPAVALLFGPQALGAAGSLVLDPGQPLQQVVLPLLLDLCEVVAAQVGYVRLRQNCCALLMCCTWALRDSKSEESGCCAIAPPLITGALASPGIHLKN